MIAKHIPIRSLNKSDFASLVDYLSDTQNKNQRVEQVRATNCASDSLGAATSEVLATQQVNTRAKSDKTFHMVISFPDGETPNNKVLNEIEDRMAAGLGYEEHQRISAVHSDTDNLHIHIAINKIHPTKHT